MVSSPVRSPPSPRNPLDRLQQNQRSIRERWPGIWSTLESAPTPSDVVVVETPLPTLSVAGLQLASGYDRRAEADLQASIVPPGSTEAWVYGLGLGELPAALLARPEISTLHVIIMSPSVAYQSLARFDHLPWLDDPRVDLCLASDETTVRRPFAASPACLRLASEESLRLRDLILLELNAPFQQEHFENRLVALQPQLETNLELVRADGDVRELFGTNKGGLAVVAAGGPTLLERLDWLSAHRDELVLLSASTAVIPLLRSGISPDIVVAIDPAPHLRAHLDGADLDRLADRTLVYYALVHADLLRKWPGRRLTAYLHSAEVSEMARQVPKGFLYSSGTVTHAAIDLAVRMGSREVVLMGADFSYVGGKSHAEGAALAFDPRDVSAGMSVLNGRRREVPSTLSFCQFLRDLEDYIKGTPEVRFVNASREGARIEGTHYLE